MSAAGSTESSRFASSPVRRISPAVRHTSLLQAFLLQGKVIWALVLREMQTRYGRENIGYLWVIGEPMLFCAGTAIVWSMIRPAHEHGLPVTAFVITGYVPLTMMRHCVSRGMKAFESNGALMFHRQVSPLDIIVGRVIIECVGTLIAGAIVAGTAMTLGFMDPPKDVGLICLGLGFQILFSASTAFLMASLSERSEIVEKLVSAVMYLSLPLTGAFAMTSWIPERYQWILLASPSVQNFEMIRGGQFGINSHPMYDVFYDAWVTGLLLLIGISMTLRSRRFIVII